ncbi:MAG: hypothetical protein Q9162_004253 [Coniocarpon cinnabarinum]
MGVFGGGFLRLLATVLYAIEFCCAAIVLGIYSYFLALLKNHHFGIARQWKAVEGLSGAACLYGIFTVLLTCFLGGISFFAFLAVILDIAFAGAFVALAVLTRDGAESCSGTVDTPFGTGNASASAGGFGPNGFGTDGGEAVTYLPTYGYICRLNSAAFAVSILGAQYLISVARILFVISARLQIWVARHHRKEKRYGPSPSNNYTSGSGRRKFWQRKRKSPGSTYTRDAEMAPVAAGAAGAPATSSHPSTGPAYDGRPSVETGYTGTTQGNSDYYGGSTNKYEPHTGYHTGPTGTAVNPYGYDTAQRGTASNF